MRRYYAEILPLPGPAEITGTQALIDVSAPQLVLSGNGRTIRVDVTVTGSPGTLHDADSIADASDENIIAPIRDLIGTHIIMRQFATGLVVVPGDGQIVSVFYK